jgi:hypothetical protein
VNDAKRRKLPKPVRGIAKPARSPRRTCSKPEPLDGAIIACRGLVLETASLQAWAKHRSGDVRAWPVRTPSFWTSPFTLHQHPGPPQAPHSVCKAAQHIRTLFACFSCMHCLRERFRGHCSSTARPLASPEGKIGHPTLHQRNSNTLHPSLSRFVRSTLE